jgi:hypothetical protein
VKRSALPFGRAHVAGVGDDGIGTGDGVNVGEVLAHDASHSIVRSQ